MKTTNRKWGKHLKSKGIVPFFMDRLQYHSISNGFQFSTNPFDFKLDEDDEDELTRAYFEETEHFPYQIYIELTNNCNLDCTFCARKVMNRDAGFMSNEIFEKIIDEISIIRPYAHIQLFGIGESTLDKKIFDKIRYAHSKNVKNISIQTNGQILMVNNYYKKIVDADIVDIGVDLDGFSEESYSKMRIGGDFNKVKTGIEKLNHYAICKGRKTRITVAYHLYPGITDYDDEMNSFVKWCEKNDIEYYFVPMHKWGNQMESIPDSNVDSMPKVHNTQRTAPCQFLWTNFMIAWDGRVPVCYQMSLCY